MKFFKTKGSSKARDISKGLRCPVCQNETIDESSAEIAADPGAGA